LTKLALLNSRSTTMKRQIATRAIIIASMVCASSAFAGSTDVKKCISESGQVTLTDEACPSGAQTVKIISTPGAIGNEQPAGDTAESRVVASERYGSARIPVRYPALLRTSTPARGLSLDVTTLRAARASMQMFDNASHSLRQQRVAGLQ
jgi:hypothetical protein